MQTTNKIFMVSPINFCYNKQTAINNLFQNKTDTLGLQEEALFEFNEYVKLLEENGVDVIVSKDTISPHTPDSIFPNNWFSTHSTGELFLYPMFAENRRKERKEPFLKAIKDNTNFTKTIDLSTYEDKNEFLEGTGSMVLDRDNKIIYACSSIRTSKKLVELVSNILGYNYIIFDATDRNNNPIYHTNVLMTIGQDFVVICLESIKDQKQKEIIINSLKTNKEIIDISFSQLEHFAGNMLEIKNNKNERLLVMSKTAKESLNENQIKQLESKCKIIAPDIHIIETNGGGSARCMIAELF